MAFYSWRDDSLILDCHLQPGAKGVGFAGLHGDRLKIRISAPPVDGKANEMLLKFLATAFAVPKHRVTLLSGQQSRQKRVAIEAPAVLPPELEISRC